MRQTRMARSFSSSAIVLLSIASLGSVARAQQEQEESDSATNEARALFEAGRTAFDAGRFDSALESFQRAHALSGRAALLFNIGSAAERLRRDEMALEYYERYLRELPEAENREFVEARVRFLREAGVGQPNARQEVEGPVETNAQAAATTAEPLTDTGGEASIVEQWWFWTLIGVVVVGAALGIGLGVGLSDPGTLAPPMGNFGTDGVAMALVRF